MDHFLSPSYTGPILWIGRVSVSVWRQCLQRLQDELPTQQFNTWIRPLQAEHQGATLVLFAPNRFVLDWVRDKYLARINALLSDFLGSTAPSLQLAVGASRPTPPAPVAVPIAAAGTGKPVVTAPASPIASNGREPAELKPWERAQSKPVINHRSNLNSAYTFENFVEGKSNQLARAAARQVGLNPGTAYNPLFLYGGTGLGKTHLMNAVGNTILASKPDAKIVYLHSERFVQDMVNALRNNTIEEFKRYYRSVDALLIDDIQFFAGKERSQEEFFHTFNALLEGNRQVILTSDRYPKEIEEVDERLKSRFGWGLTVAVEPPELETRVAILISKAEQSQVELPHEVAFFIAKRIRSNVRDLEGALKRVLANAHFTGKAITLDFVREALKDLIAAQDKQVSIDNIQKTVAEYYSVKVSDLLSKRRNRSVARPRQMAMAMAKELTNHSLPEIGDAFGGRDHTTVLHACRKIKELMEESREIEQDYSNLMRILST